MIKLLTIVAIALFQTGCATIISGRHQEVPVISSPHGAKACTSGQCVTTPGSFTLRRDSNHIVVIEKDGYLPETVTLTSGVGAAVAGNLIFGGIIGGGIDMASGAAYKLYPETVNVALRQMPGPANGAGWPSISPEVAPSSESTTRLQNAVVNNSLKITDEFWQKCRVGGELHNRNTRDCLETNFGISVPVSVWDSCRNDQRRVSRSCLISQGY